MHTRIHACAKSNWCTTTKPAVTELLRMQPHNTDMLCSHRHWLHMGSRTDRARGWPPEERRRQRHGEGVIQNAQQGGQVVTRRLRANGRHGAPRVHGGGDRQAGGQEHLLERQRDRRVLQLDPLELQCRPEACASWSATDRSL